MSNIYDALKKRQDRSRGEKPARPAPVPPRNSKRAPLSAALDPKRDQELESLRQRVLLEVGSERAPVLVFTGAVPGEGATTLIVHFALELASAEQRPILLVDGDLGGASHTLTTSLQEAGANSPGLQEYLNGRCELTDAIVGTEQENLFFMSSGTPSDSPVEMLEPERVRQALQEMGRHYAFVLIDAGAPIVALETGLLASATDGVVLVVRANKTRREVVQRAVQILNRAHCRVLGVVLNDRRYPIPAFLYRRI